jgi:hypothetical protein
MEEKTYKADQLLSQVVRVAYFLNSPFCQRNSHTFPLSPKSFGSNNSKGSAAAVV